MTFNYPLYLVTDELSNDQDMAHIIDDALLGGVSIVQMRSKSQDKSVILKRALVAKEIVQKFNQAYHRSVPILINDHLDVAIEVDADGVHLGQSDQSVIEARCELGEKKIVGLTVNTLDELIKAQALPVDYLGVGSIFKTQTKLDIKNEWGVTGLKEAVLRSQLPLVAIGGIHAFNIEDVAKTGVHSIALVSAIFQSNSPRKTSESLLNQILKNQPSQ